jgi:hypothetical protein
MAFSDQLFQYIDIIYLIFLYGWPFMLLTWIMILKFKWKNWPVDVVIIEKRGDNLVKTNDRAGKFIDPYTKIIGYKLLKAKDTLPVVNYDWVMVNVAVNTTMFDKFVNLLRGNIGTIFLFRYGSKQYKPILIKENNQGKWILKEIRDKSNSPILINVYEQFDPRKQIGVLDFEVIDWDNMNFMVQEQRATFERRQKASAFWKEIIVPVTMMIVAALVIIVMFKFSYDWAVGMAAKGGSTPAANNQPAAKPNIPVIGSLVP